MTQILNRWNGDVIIEGEMNLRELVLHAIREKKDLSYADLSSANLSSADLSSANLSSANLSSANLSYADLSSANLRSADLRYADLRYADLRYADLRYADLDYTSIPFQCSSLQVKVCDKLAAQMLFHAFALAKIKPTKNQIEFMKNFHRFDECGGEDTLTKKLEV